MQTVKKLVLVIIVFGAMAAFLISTGKWYAAVVGPVQAVFGQNAANRVDDLGQRSNQIATKAGDLTDRILDGILGDKVDPAAVNQALASVPTTPDVRIPPYARAAFGNSWTDVDHNGCDTRNDVLNRDLTAVIHTTGDCVVRTGRLADPYTAKTINFLRGSGTSSAVQIDHIVPLGLAWSMGAYSWDDGRRLAFANDQNGLLAVDGPTNGSKSDKGPGRWLPANRAYQCVYAAKFVYVVVEYGLSMAADDKSAIGGALSTCP